MKIIAAFILTMLMSTQSAFGDTMFKVYADPGVNVKGECTSTSILSNDKKTLTATVELTSCKTGIGLRDKHMREDLDTEHFPVAKLVANLQADSFSGTLTVKGVSKPVKGTRKDGELSFKTKLSEFGVPRRQQLFWNRLGA